MVTESESQNDNTVTIVWTEVYRPSSVTDMIDGVDPDLDCFK